VPVSRTVSGKIRVK